MVPEGLTELYKQHIQMQFDFFSQLLQQFAYERVVISAGELKYQFLDDNSYPFKLNAYFAQWLNLPNGSGSQILIEQGQDKPILYYYLPEDIWHKPSTIDQSVVYACFEVVNVNDVSAFQCAVKSSGITAYIGDEDSCVITSSCVINPNNLLTSLDYHRAYKSEYEQACMTLANESAVKGHKAAAKSFYQGESEYCIQVAYLKATAQLDNDQPYNSIIALNEHAAVLHYPNKSRNIPVEHLSLLIDAGTCVGGYASDISRTYAKAGTDFADLIATMDGVQRSLVEAIKPGVSYVELHLLAHKKIADLLIDSGIASGQAAWLVEQGVTSVFFPHGLGHYLGLQVHDKGGWLHSARGDEQKPPQAHPFLRLTRKVECNQVFTIEPGLYFIEALLLQAKSDARAKAINWDVVDHYKAFGGIRIEDNVLLKDSGVSNLTRSAGLQ